MLSPDSNCRSSNSFNSSTPTKNKRVTSTPNSVTKLKVPVINYNNYSMIKSASTSDIPLATKVALDSTTMSESEVLKVIDIFYTTFFELSIDDEINNVYVTGTQ